jgi:hypothetical protein
MVSKRLTVDVAEQAALGREVPPERNTTETVFRLVCEAADFLKLKGERRGAIIVIGRYASLGEVPGARDDLRSNPFKGQYVSAGDKFFQRMLLQGEGVSEGAVVADESGQILGGGIMLVIDHPEIKVPAGGFMRHLAAASTSMRREVISVITLSEENNVVRVFIEGKVAAEYNPLKPGAQPPAVPRELLAKKIAALPAPAHHVHQPPAPAPPVAAQTPAPCQTQGGEAASSEVRADSGGVPPAHAAPAVPKATAITGPEAPGPKAKGSKRRKTAARVEGKPRADVEKAAQLATPAKQAPEKSAGREAVARPSAETESCLAPPLPPPSVLPPPKAPSAAVSSGTPMPVTRVSGRSRSATLVMDGSMASEGPCAWRSPRDAPKARETTRPVPTAQAIGPKKAAPKSKTSGTVRRSARKASPGGAKARPPDGRMNTMNRTE